MIKITVLSKGKKTAPKQPPAGKTAERRKNGVFMYLSRIKLIGDKNSGVNAKAVRADRAIST